MDEKRKAVVNELIEDSSQPRKNIAHKLGVSESFISKVVKTLLLDEAIDRFSMLLNYSKFHINNHAISLIKLKDVSGNHVEHIAKNIADYENCLEVFTAFGEYDIFVRWLSADNEDLNRSIQDILASESVHDIVTYPLGTKYKRIYGPNIK